MTGLAESIEYILTPAVIVVGIGGYVGTIAESSFGLVLPVPIWWALRIGSLSRFFRTADTEFADQRR